VLEPPRRDLTLPLNGEYIPFDIFPQPQYR
jgi:hypothetical protein